MENEGMLSEKLNKHFRAAYLIAGFIRHTLTVKEEEELDEWILENDDNMQLFEELTDEEKVGDFLRWYYRTNTEARLQEVKSKMDFEDRTEGLMIKKDKWRVWRYAAVAAITLIAVAGVIYYFQTRNNISPSDDLSANDIQPGTEQAVFKLDNGQSVSLNRQTDTIINDEVRIVSGEIIYSNENDQASAKFHELIIPRKGFYRLTLPDGTRAWINSASSIRFPVGFANGQRIIYLDGEAFFDVAKDSLHPFIVDVRGTIIRAKGTSFNINAYTNENGIRACLVTGSIQIIHEGDTIYPLPGEQALIQQGKKMQLAPTDVSIITAWTKNMFMLKNNPLPEVMRTIERWYDVKVNYSNDSDAHFNGNIERSVTVSRFVRLLEETGHVRFTVKDNTVSVK